ncbi:MAG: FtsQ-type POTRA domain-containing protein [Ruminiclostridium sp.]|nr:FtsQ-type POTRA domain-containing protein [Ruminiclostridium sp.]
MPDFHRLNRSRTVEMSKEELKKKLQEETERSQKKQQKQQQKPQKPKKPNPVTVKRQQKITEQTKKQLPPQSPNRKKREQEAKRLAEKELREKKKRRKRGSNVVYYVMLSILAVIIFAILSVTVLFNTERIIVEGESDYTDEQIIAASGLKGDENLVRLSTAGIPERMLYKLVKLDSVSVEKVFPSTIKIKVTRSVPMVSFSYGGKNYVISHIGRVMYIDSEDVDCMHVIGYKPAESVVVGSFIKAENEEQDKLIQQISAAVEKIGLTNITSLNITDTLDIIMTYDARVEIHLGSVLQIDEKMRAVNELLNNGYIADTEYVTLNASDPSRIIQRPITTAAIIVDTPEEESGEEGEEGEGSSENADENTDTTA